MIDNLVSSAIEIGKDKLQGDENESKTSFGKGLLRFIVTAVWLLITLLVSIGAFLLMMGQGFSDMFGGEDTTLGVLAVSVSLVITLITFIVPYLRKKGSLTRWCGIICLGDAIWWIYLMATGSI